MPIRPILAAMSLLAIASCGDPNATDGSSSENSVTGSTPMTGTQTAPGGAGSMGSGTDSNGPGAASTTPSAP